ncbi:MAG: hypothetical protein QOE81_1446 [Verrucomicrobiota bacterium]|jgi:hypothetical protein
MTKRDCADPNHVSAELDDDRRRGCRRTWALGQALRPGSYKSGEIGSFTFFAHLSV